MKDITGCRYGRLVADKFLYYDEKHRDHWLFRCDCGTEKEMAAANVKWGNVRSCGCMAKEHMKSLRIKNISGQQFGRLTAIQPTEQRDSSGSIVWKCQCECGETVFYSVNSLMKAKTQSCGCLFRETRKECTSHRRDITEQTNLSSLVSAKELRSDNQSGYTGVCFERKAGKWTAQIIFRKKRYRLGSYKDKETAVKARQYAEKCLHDPVIQDNWDSLTQHSKEKFIRYLHQSVDSNCKQGIEGEEQT